MKNKIEFHKGLRIDESRKTMILGLIGMLDVEIKCGDEVPTLTVHLINKYTLTTSTYINTTKGIKEYELTHTTPDSKCWVDRWEESVSIHRKISGKGKGSRYYCLDIKNIQEANKI